MDQNNMKSNGKHNHSGQLIELKDVTKTYHTPAGIFTALNGVTLSIGSGEFVSIVGKSGSGKTTLINLVTGIDDPSSGEVYVGGTPVHTLKEGQKASWRGATVGVVFQFFQLLPTLTVLENVMLPMGLNSRLPISKHADRAMALLELVDLTESAHQLPSMLSGGLQQRAAIARAMANDPPIIATDEPTGNLDTRSAESVMRLFENLVRQGKTILMVTHDPDLAKRATRIIEIADGKIVSGG